MASGTGRLTTKMPLRDEDGTIIGTFGISRDITAMKNAQAALEQAYDEMEKRAVELARAKEAAEAAKNEAEKARKDAEAANRSLAAQMWQTTGQALLNDKMRGEQDVPTLASNVIQQLCKYLDAQVGALYVREDDVLKLAGTYAYRRKNSRQ